MYCYNCNDTVTETEYDATKDVNLCENCSNSIVLMLDTIWQGE